MLTKNILGIVLQDGDHAVGKMISRMLNQKEAIRLTLATCVCVCVCAMSSAPEQLFRTSHPQQIILKTRQSKHVYLFNKESVIFLKQQYNWIYFS